MTLPSGPAAFVDRRPVVPLIEKPPNLVERPVEGLAVRIIEQPTQGASVDVADLRGELPQREVLIEPDAIQFGNLVKHARAPFCHDVIDSVVIHGPEIFQYARQSCQAQLAIAALSRGFVTCGAVISFKELLREGAKKFASQQAFAEALGVSTARLNRALNKGDYPFNVLNCLRLARVTDERPSDVLRAAGKGEIADLIERSYGNANALTASQQEALDLWGRISSGLRASLLEVMRTSLAAGGGVVPPHGAGERPPSRRGTRGRKSPAARRGRRPKGESPHDE